MKSNLAVSFDAITEMYNERIDSIISDKDDGGFEKVHKDYQRDCARKLIWEWSDIVKYFCLSDEYFEFHKTQMENKLTIEHEQKVV